MNKTLPLVHPVILSGGSGSRLWPLSRRLYPKQLLPLTGARTMIQDTALRFTRSGFAAPFIICNQEHRFLIAEQLRESGVNDSTVVLEPSGRNTAPATAVAALILQRSNPEAMMVLLPSDHVIADVAAFHAAVEKALPAAQDGALV